MQLCCLLDIVPGFFRYMRRFESWFYSGIPVTIFFYWLLLHPFLILFQLLILVFNIKNFLFNPFAWWLARSFRIPSSNPIAVSVSKIKYWNSPLGVISTDLLKMEIRLSPHSVVFNPLNAELNPICCLLALLGAHHFLHVSRIRVKSLTLRLLMSYIYIYIYWAPILDVSRSHTTTHHSR